MIISKIRIRNFYSIEDIELDLKGKKGVIFIEGKNKDANGGSNGCGKSSIYEAIVFGLFGKTIRRSNEESLVNNKAKRDLYVSISIEPDIVITRTRRPTFLSFKVGHKDLTKESVTETQLAIEAFFGINYKTFLTANVFGQQNELDFISSTLEDKRTIMRNFLNLDDVFTLREKIKDRKSDVSSEIKAKNTLIIDYEKDIGINERVIKDGKEEVERLKKKLNITKSYDLSEILGLERDKAELEELRKGTITGLNYLNSCVSELEGELKKGICIYCESVLKPLTKEEETKFKKDIAEKKVLIKENTVHFENILQRIKDFKIPVSSKDFSKLEELNKLELSIELYEKSTGILKDKVKNTSEAKNNLSKELEILKFWEIVFSEQGLVKYVIRSILDYFNNRCLHYLSYITNAKFSLIFDDSLQEKILVSGVETSYHSLSGGEKKKVNLAVLLALQSILDFNTKGRCNLLLLDEVVESIDDETIIGVNNLMTELSKDKLILIITHNSTLKELLYDKPKISLVKKNGITKIV